MIHRDSRERVLVRRPRRFFERAAPIYRKAWWPKHRDDNRTWQKSIESLVEQYGNTILAFVTNAYKMDWPATGFPVHICAYANWAGAYSTNGNLLVVSSRDVTTQGDYGLEAVFHEGMHQWDQQVLAALEAQKGNKAVPPNLSHALIFFTAGEAIQRVIPEHTPTADKFGVWERGFLRFKRALEEVWKPYLDGHGTRDEAFAELIVRTGRDFPVKDKSK